MSLLLLSAGATAAKADDVESLHIFNANFDLRPGLTLQLHSRLRTFENMSSFNQGRIGPIITWRALPRLSLTGGYYFTHQNTRVIHRTYDLHRSWGGGQIRLLTFPRWTLDSRHVLERFAVPVIPDYFRQRHRAVVNFPNKRISPFISGEALRQHKIWYGRYVGGIQFRPQRRFLMSLAYEYRDAPIGPGSHVIGTMIQFDALRRPE